MTTSTNDSNRSIIAVATTVGIGLLSAHCLYRRYAGNLRKVEVSSSFMAWVQLTEQEENFLKMGLAPISTVTWFEGDIHEAQDLIKERMQRIIELNPYLTGKFQKRQGHYHIVYSKDKSDISVKSHAMTKDLSAMNDVASIISSGDLHHEMPHLETMKKSKAYILQEKKEFSQPFWKVVLVPSSTKPTTHYALFCSISHVLGDGHTYYSLYNMLTGAEPIVALQVDRVMTTLTQQKEKLGAAEASVMASPGIIVCAIRGLLSDALLSSLLGIRSKPQSRIFDVDPQLMQAQKKLNTDDGEVEFVSTNDVVTSWFFNQTKCQHGLMALNFRSRLEGHANDLVGNYENCLYYSCPSHTSQPWLIRKSLKTLKRVGATDDSFRSMDMAWEHISVVTNWATFVSSNDIDMVNSRQLIHLPVVANAPTTLSFCVIFQPRPNQVAVLVSGSPERIEDVAPFESATPLLSGE